MVYTQVVLIPEIENPETITCLESYGQSIYLGTNSGEIIHYFRANENEFIFASRQKSKKRAVKGIWILPQSQRALVLTSSTTSVFSLPEFAPCNMKSMRDVQDVSCEDDGQDEITVFSSSAIRIVKIDNDELKLVKNIEYPGVLAGVRRSSFALVASDTYDLIDLDNIQKIPLFPVATKRDEEEVTDIEPTIIPMETDEFLVTSGTKKDEPAMGLVVNIHGDISRGTIAWPAYPSSVAVDFPNVAAVIDKKVLIYSLIDQSLIQTIDYTNEENVDSLKVVNVKEPYEARSEEVEEKLKRVLISSSEEETQTKTLEFKQKSSIFLYSNKVECLLSSPRLIELEKIDNDDDLYDEMERFDLSAEQSILELEYLKMLIGLRNLQKKKIDAPIWMDGSLDPRVVIYIYSPEDIQGSFWIFNGLKELIKDIPKKNDNFFKHFLTQWLTKRHLESVADKHDVFASIELAYLRLLIRTKAQKEEIYALIDNEIIESNDGSGEDDRAAQMLMDSKRYFLLSRLYQKQGRIKDVLEAWKKMLTKEWKDSEFSKGEEKMTAYLVQCQDDDLVWEYGVWLTQRYSPAVKVFKTGRFDDQKVIDEFKKFSSDEPRREFLKYLVYEKKSELFTSDLISFLVDDLLEKIDVKQVTKTYKDYAALEAKRSYIDYLSGIQSKKPNNQNKLRLEILYLLQSSEYDAETLLRRMEGYPLTMELCIVQGRLGLHEQVIDTLCHTLHDYETAVEYCSKQQNLETALFSNLFTQFLKLERENDRIKCVERLLNNFGHFLDSTLVLTNTPNEWPVGILGVYLHQVVRKLTGEKNNSIVAKSLARSESSFMSKQLEGMKQLANSGRST